MSEIYLGKPSQKIIEFCEKKYENLIPLCFEAKTTGCTVALMKQGSPDEISLQTSTDRKAWTDYTVGTSIALPDIGDRVYFRQKGDTGTFNTNSVFYYYFKLNNGGIDGEVECHGNVMSLAFQHFEDQLFVGREMFNSLFENCKVLKTAPALPATTLAILCYNNMFSRCSSLTQAPALPATTLAEGCYNYMFSRCSSLTQAPALPATTLASYCYYYMFSNCTSLTLASALPVTSLALWCYYGMFYGCTSLAQAPALPATTLASGCYNSMFNGCTSLTQAADISSYSYSGNGEYDSEYAYTSSLTSISWLSLSRSDIESLVLQDYVFGYEDDGVQRTITYQNNAKVKVYWSDDQESFVIEDI